MKKTLFTSFLALSIVLAGCSVEDIDNLEADDTSEETAQVEAVEESEVVEDVSMTEEADVTDGSSDRDAEELYYQIMQENLGMYVSVEFDEVNKIFNLTPIDQDLITAISMLPNGVGHEEWGVMVDALASMSNTGTGLVGEGYTINLVNPMNHDNIILWIIDGEIIYNVVDEL